VSHGTLLDIPQRILTVNHSYEIGTNALFDDRVQEFVVYEDLIKSELSKQGPDRVFGLQNTRNFDTLLSSPVRPDLAGTPEDTIADILKTTPFKTQADPLLFPFLVLEAKSETSSRGFDAIQVQSSFPIRALLKMQDDLRSHVSDGERAFDPLVWFLASRGDAWKVYGSYVTKGGNGEPTKYVSRPSQFDRCDHTLIVGEIILRSSANSVASRI
jgi:hypothetical protein